MKKTIISFAFVTALLVSCNETKNKEVTLDEVETTETEHAHLSENIEAENPALSNAWKNEIKLDNGVKWTANLETNEGVEKMINLVKNHNAETIESYHALASDLNDVKNYVVKECTMKGPSHDNLHVFLHPLIEKIDALGKTNSVEEAAMIETSTMENLEGYNAFFQ